MTKEKASTNGEKRESPPSPSRSAWFDDQPIIARGPEAERLAKQYRETLMRHSRLNPDNTPSAWSRAALLLLVVLLFYYAIQGRIRVIQWKRMVQTLNGEPWDTDYTNMDRLSPMDDRAQPRHEEF